jgi:taurine dioxygenase
MTVFAFSHRPLASIGAEVEFDLSGQLCGAQQEALRALLYSQGLLLFRGQSLSDDDQTRILGIFGPVLVEEGGHREIAADGNLGCCRLLYHSDLAFTPEPFKLLSLYGLEVEPERNITLFASATKAAETLPVVLRKRIAPLEVRTVIPASQVERATSHETPDFLPQVTGSMLMPHPVTGRPILNVSEMQTSRVEGFPPEESEALLQELFRHLYAPSNCYEHHWRNGDLVVWDNIAMQHGRPDQTNTGKRRLRRIAVADKTFFQLCPQFSIEDPRIIAWGSGGTLMVD